MIKEITVLKKYRYNINNFYVRIGFHNYNYVVFQLTWFFEKLIFAFLLLSFSFITKYWTSTDHISYCEKKRCKFYFFKENTIQIKTFKKKKKMHHAKNSRLYIIFHCGFYDFIISLLISAYVSIYTFVGTMEIISYICNFRTIGLY